MTESAQTEETTATPVPESAPASKAKAPKTASETVNAEAREPTVPLSFGENVRRQFRFLLMGIWTAYCTLTGLMLQKVLGDPGGKINDRWKQRWGRGARWILGLDTTLHSQLPPPVPGRGRLVVANHRTPLDIVSLMAEFGGIFLANHKTREAPIIGPAAHAVLTIFVDRDDRQSGAQAIRAMRRHLQEGRTVVVFPEGTTYAGDEVRELKGGALIAASGLDVDIVPVGLAYPPGTEYTEQRLSNHARRFLSRSRTRVAVVIGEPMPAPKSRKGLEDELRTRVQVLVDKAREKH